MEYIGIAGKRFWKSIFLRLIHPEIILQEFTLAHHKENEEQFHKLQGRGTLYTRDEKENGGTIPMPTFAGRPSTMSSTIPVEFLQNSMVGQQRKQISEPQFDKSPYTFYIHILEDKIQKPSDYLF